MNDRRQLERWVGAVLAPEVRSPGTIASVDAVTPSPEYLRRFPPELVVAFGRTPAGATSPTPWIQQVRSACEDGGAAAPLVACDLEQGAGLHFAEAQRLPPALALASAALSSERESAGLDWLRAAGELTGREARACGVDLVLAPVADVNTQRSNPIVAVRSFGDEPRAAGRRATAFAVGLHAGGALACAKHFPGHGDTTQDSHIELARVAHTEAELSEVEFEPFRQLIAHGVDTCMVGHLDVPALTGAAGFPATFSARALEHVLRGELGFSGVVLSDAMNMGALAKHERRYLRALSAGCDVLLCPHDPIEAALELLAAVDEGALSLERLALAASRAAGLRARAAARASKAARAPMGGSDSRLVEALAQRSLRWFGAPWSATRAASRIDFAPAQLGVESSGLLRAAFPGSDAGRGIAVVVALEMGAWRGSYGLSQDDEADVRATLGAALERGDPASLVWFGSPQLLPQWALAEPRLTVLFACAPTPPLVRAAARAWNEGGCAPSNRSLPTGAG